MRTFDVSKIPVDSFFSEPVYIDDEFILTSQEMAFTSKMKESLGEWRFDKVKSNGDPQEKSNEIGSAPKDIAKLFLNDSAKLAEAKMFYVNFRCFARDILYQAANKTPINYDMIAEKIHGVCNEIKMNRRFLLLVQKDVSVNSDEDFLVTHTVNSTIISIIIGIYFKLPAHRLIELGTAALLHEIGMIKLPPNIVQSKMELSKKDRAALMMHPLLGFEILRSLGFPMAISTAALEHHERENGSGYPHKLIGDRISLYGKIIAVACSYDAITSKRPHKDAAGGYEGIMDILRNEGKCYDDTVVRALVFSLSIYPIGQLVLLSNGEKGNVIDVNPTDPRYPIVQILGEKNSGIQNRIIETSPTGVHIAGPLTTNEYSPPPPPIN
ncbi:MAG: HD domain-containing protein [Spirochaetaceae bacterium]|jgi:HD-GYP domain-containing protein (c-di-GMP phosphodiesterase class II)|nr:HD domain-containing protein [Spirochaetaceae bacterium]